MEEEEEDTDDCSTSSSCGSSSTSSWLEKGIPRPANKKSVRFAEERNTVQSVPHIDDMPLETIDAVWYNQDDYNQMKSSRNLTIYLIESGKLESLIFEGGNNDEKHTARGLENRTKSGSMKRNENKCSAYSAVLDEQRKHLSRFRKKKKKMTTTTKTLNKGSSNEDGRPVDIIIAARYTQQSAAKCAEEAVARALLDEKEAMQVFRGGIQPTVSSILHEIDRQKITDKDLLLYPTRSILRKESSFPRRGTASSKETKTETIMPLEDRSTSSTPKLPGVVLPAVVNL